MHTKMMQLSLWQTTESVSELEPFTEDLVQSSLTLTGVVLGSNCYHRRFHTKVEVHTGECIPSARHLPHYKFINALE